MLGDTILHSDTADVLFIPDTSLHGYPVYDEPSSFDVMQKENGSTQASTRRSHIADLIRNATATELIQYNNMSYLKLQIEHDTLRYVYITVTVYSLIDRFKSMAYDTLLHAISHGGQAPAGSNSISLSQSAAGPPFGATVIPPPLMSVPLDHQNFPEVPYWTQEEYSNRDLPVNSRGVKTSKNLADKEDLKTLSFVTGPDGIPLTEGRVADIKSIFRSGFHELKQRGVAPSSWAKLIISERETFYRRIYNSVPELAYCSSDWKAKHIATDLYPSFARYYLQEGRRQHKSADKGQKRADHASADDHTHADTGFTVKKVKLSHTSSGRLTLPVLTAVDDIMSSVSIDGNPLPDSVQTTVVTPAVVPVDVDISIAASSESDTPVGDSSNVQLLNSPANKESPMAEVDGHHASSQPLDSTDMEFIRDHDLGEADKSSKARCADAPVTVCSLPDSWG